MARYIDADALCTYFKILYEHAQTNGMYNHAKLYDRAFQAVADAPTAEVVPKSEVYRLNAVMKDIDEQRAYTINMLGENLENAKAEVERLQAEIETLKDNNEHLAVLLEEAKQAYANYEETTGLKQAKQEVAREIFEEIEKILSKNRERYSVGGYHYDHYKAKFVAEAIAELKKKYTEED